MTFTYTQGWLISLIPLALLIWIDVCAPKEFRLRGFVFGSLMGASFLIGTLVCR